MDDDLKQQIRRRLYGERIKNRQPLGELSNYFATCPRCSGRGEVGESLANGAEIDYPCPTCDGDGFIPTRQGNEGGHE